MYSAQLPVYLDKVHGLVASTQRNPIPQTSILHVIDEMEKQHDQSDVRKSTIGRQIRWSSMLNTSGVIRRHHAPNEQFPLFRRAPASNTVPTLFSFFLSFALGTRSRDCQVSSVVLSLGTDRVSG
jgi:hypothetical protein